MSKIDERCHENVQPIKKNIMSVLIYTYIKAGGWGVGGRFHGNVISQV